MLHSEERYSDREDHRNDFFHDKLFLNCCLSESLRRAHFSHSLYAVELSAFASFRFLGYFAPCCCFRPLISLTIALTTGFGDEVLMKLNKVCFLASFFPLR